MSTHTYRGFTLETHAYSNAWGHGSKTQVYYPDGRELYGALYEDENEAEAHVDQVLDLEMEMESDRHG